MSDERKFANLPFLLSLLIILILITSGLAALIKIDKLIERNRELRARNDAARMRLKENESELLRALDDAAASHKSSAELSRQIEDLQDELEKQKGEFERMLERSREKSELKKDAELLEARDQFAAEKLEFLKRVQELRAETERNENRLETAREKSLERARQKDMFIERLQTRLEQNLDNRDRFIERIQRQNQQQNEAIQRLTENLEALTRLRKPQGARETKGGYISEPETEFKRGIDGRFSGQPYVDTPPKDNDPHEHGSINPPHPTEDDNLEEDDSSDSRSKPEEE